MKNRRILTMSLILVVLLSVPVFAGSDAVTEAAAETADTAELAISDVLGEQMDAADETEETEESEEAVNDEEGETESEASEDNDKPPEEEDKQDDPASIEDDSAESDEIKEEADTEKEKIRSTTSGSIFIVVCGKGEVYKKDGAFVYSADKGYEIVSIVCDKDTKVSKAGEEVIAGRLDADLFPENSKLTFVFDEKDTGDGTSNEIPESMGAVFE